MAAAVMGFYSAYAEGDLLDEDGSGEGKRLYFDGELVAMGETAEFIVANGERFGIASSDLEEGYLHWVKSPDNEVTGDDVYVAEWTGKEVE